MKNTCTIITTPSTRESLINQFRVCFVKVMQVQGTALWLAAFLAKIKLAYITMSWQTKQIVLINNIL
jgi:hypothetical protein